MQGTERQNMCSDCQHRQKPEGAQYGLAGGEVAGCYRAVRTPDHWEPPGHPFFPMSCPQGKEDLRVLAESGESPETLQRFDVESEGKWDYSGYYDK